MHQRLERSSHESVIDEDVLFDRQRGILLLEIAGAITMDTKTERQILSARRRSDWIGLHEPENIDRTRQGRRPPQAADDGHSTEIVECRRALSHQEILARPERHPYAVRNRRTCAVIHDTRRDPFRPSE